jgi:hypothetical protein
MKEPSLVTKLSEEVQRARKLGTNRSLFMQSKVNSKQLSRLKSNQEGPGEDIVRAKVAIKPRSSKGFRPLSSQKHFETATVKTNTTASSSSSRSEEEVKELIQSIFTRSKKLQEFLESRGLNPAETLSNLINNELFTLSLVAGIASKNPEEVGKYVELCCIQKVERGMKMEKQKTICEQL